MVTKSLKLNLDVFLCDQNIIGSSSGIFGYLRKMFGNVCLAFGQLLENLWKSSESVRKSALKDKIRIHARACNILYVQHQISHAVHLMGFFN